MPFNSFDFLIFFTLVTAVLYVLPLKARWVFLLLASVAFYLMFDLRYMLVAGLVIILSFTGGYLVSKQLSQRKRKQLLILFIVLTVAVLLVLKYTGFFLWNLNQLLRISGSNALFPIPEWLLPVGLSYYILQAVSYMTDIYRGEISREKNFFRYALYILFFPKIMMGPLERAGSMLPQISQAQHISASDFTGGLKLILWGFFKKLVISARIGIYVDAVYSSWEYHSGLTLLLTAFLFFLQLYADFSGYTDIAIGVGKLLGYRLSPNFNKPVFASSVADFWRRWHMSFSLWINDYIYKPLSIATRYWGTAGVILSLLLAFLLVGFWHGASWNYIFFGLLMAMALGYEVLARKPLKKLKKLMPAWLWMLVTRLLTITFMALSMVFFRAENMAEGFAYFSGISLVGQVFVPNISAMVYMVTGIALLLVVETAGEFFNGRISLFSHKSIFIRWAVYLVLLVWLLAAGVFDAGQFLYFKF